MIPKYPVGSLIYVKKIDPLLIQEKDSITFYMSGSKIVATHEVYLNDKENELFRTQGINNKDEKGNIIKDVNPVSYDNYIGKPILCVNYLGYINKYITTSPGIYIIAITTIFVVAISYLIDKKIKRK